MEDFLQKIYENPKLYLKKFFIGVVILLICVHVLYKMKTGIYWLESDWTSGDLLSFIGTMLSFVGSVVLGCITVKLSKDNNEINERLTTIENKREIIEQDERLGYIWPEKIELEYEHGTGNGSNCYTVLTNQCTKETEAIFIRFKMKVTAKSVINFIKNVRISIWETFPLRADTIEDEFSGIPPFYIQKESFIRNLDLGDKCFEEILILSDRQRETEGFYKLKEIMLKRHRFYTIQLEYIFSNTLNEKRKEVLNIVFSGNQVEKVELVSLE